MRITKRITEHSGSPKRNETSAQAEREEEDALLKDENKDFYFAPHTFSRAITTQRGIKLPQAIAHRGFKARYPENTLLALESALKVGVHALETDIHLTKDNIVVLAHDPSLKRCFGQPEKISGCTWGDLSTLRTIAKPPSGMPRLKDLLELMAKPEYANSWVMLDIKLDNDADTVMRLIAETINGTDPAPGRPWHERIVLGIWSPHFLPFCHRYLPTYPVNIISLIVPWSLQFLLVKNIGFTPIFTYLPGPLGALCRYSIRSKNRPILAWHVMTEKQMRKAINYGVDGVICDDPELFLKVCADVEVNGRDVSKEMFSIKETGLVAFWQFVLCFLFVPVSYIWGLKWTIDRRFWA